MGYTTVMDPSGAVTAVAPPAAADRGRPDSGFPSGLLVDQLMAEASVVEPHVAALALDRRTAT
ncbi:MAG: hypothetical protein LBJ87_00980 [bacterium]|jgi:hypothetical protein|nr:hypothetical protein [bacterium]